MVDSSKTARIVVGVDGSVSSIDALRRAATIAAAVDAPLEAVTTWQYPVEPVAGYPLGAWSLGDWSPEDDAKAILAKAVEAAFGGEVPKDLTTTTLQGAAAAALIKRSAGADLLVLGSRGHGGFAGLLLGSVSAACAEHAHCPVLIMHRDGDGSGAESAE